MKHFLLSLTMIFIYIVFCFLFSCSSTSFTQTNQTGNQSKITISVFSGSTPIENATVCIIETQEYYYTNKHGTTAPIYLLSSKQSLIQKNISFTEYTLLVYKNGYLPHIYYGLKITHNQNRLGIAISLTEYGILPNATFTESYEYPPKSFSENIITTYKK